MWPFKRKKHIEETALAERIASMSDRAAKSVFTAVAVVLGDKLLLGPVSDDMTIPVDLPKSVVAFFKDHTSFSPRFMDLRISVDDVGESESMSGHIRIGFESGWSEVLCDSEGHVFTVYSEDALPRRSDEAVSIWHYCIAKLASVYPEVVARCLPT